MRRLKDNVFYLSRIRTLESYNHAMSTAVVITERPHFPGLSLADAERVYEAFANSRAANTRRAYAMHWAKWRRWAERRHVQELPANPAQVAAFLADLSVAGASISAVRLARAAVAAIHRSAGVPDPTVTEGVKRVVSGLARMDGRPQKQATGLTRDGLAAIKATALLPRSSAGGRRESPWRAKDRGLVDIALVSVMRDGLLRASEAAEIAWRDVEWASDGSGRITVRRSKTDQTGNGAVLYLGMPTMQSLAAIRKWHPDPRDLVFQLSSVQIWRRIKAAAKAAGLEGHYSGHSPRVGMAQDLSAAGCELPALMTAGRWESPSMPARYTRGETAARGAVARYYSRAGGLSV